ncbi:LAMP1 protein, partial [Atractosteus spatula]|nr:LAMP1 protein [Atractosteus spatula]
MAQRSGKRTFLAGMALLALLGEWRWSCVEAVRQPGCFVRHKGAAEPEPEPGSDETRFSRRPGGCCRFCRGWRASALGTVFRRRQGNVFMQAPCILLAGERKYYEYFMEARVLLMEGPMERAPEWEDGDGGCACPGCLHPVHAVLLEVKEGNVSCIIADLSANFSVLYSLSSGMGTAQLVLPSSAEVDKSSRCGNTSLSPLLVASFGNGHSLSLGFFRNETKYGVGTLNVTFNLNDNATFPDAKSKGKWEHVDPLNVSSSSTGILAQLNTTYRCISTSRVVMDSVNVTFTNMRVEAYVKATNLSKEGCFICEGTLRCTIPHWQDNKVLFIFVETVCAADASATTTSAPKTTPVTTMPAPTMAPGNPLPGNYNVTNQNGTCLLATMGLQLNFTYFSAVRNKTVQDIVNLQPNFTKSSGSCEASSATLILMYERTNLTFTFTLNSTVKKYHLSALGVDASLPDMTAPFSASNATLDNLRGTLGKSYMCNSKQTLVVSDRFSVNTFRLQVQPFGVSNSQFGAVEECQLDEDNMLIPIIVGAALAGLVLIVLIAYLIGRKRSHAGYQTI